MVSSTRTGASVSKCMAPIPHFQWLNIAFAGKKLGISEVPKRKFRMAFPHTDKTPTSGGTHSSLYRTFGKRILFSTLIRAYVGNGLLWKWFNRERNSVSITPSMFPGSTTAVIGFPRSYTMYAAEIQECMALAPPWIRHPQVPRKIPTRTPEFEV